LLTVLPEYRQDANVWAVFPPRLMRSAKIRVCIEFLRQHLERYRSQQQ
jgi:LysR family transcriptional activator of dmlA